MRISAFVMLSLLTACRGDPPQGPLEEACARDCRNKFKECDESACVRGCRLSLDRLAEHESAALFQCVEKKGKSCEEYTWANCAARIGPHADGGPPLPPKKDEEDQ